MCIRDRVFHVLALAGGVTLAVEDFDLVAGIFQRGAEGGLVLLPTRLVLRRQHDADSTGDFSGRRFFPSRAEGVEAGEVVGAVVAGVDQGFDLSLIHI